MLNKLVDKLFLKLIHLVPNRIDSTSNTYCFKKTIAYIQFIPRLEKTIDRNNTPCEIKWTNFMDADFEIPTYPSGTPDSIMFDFCISIDGISYKVSRFAPEDYASYMKIIQDNRKLAQIKSLENIYDEIVQDKSIDNGLF